MCFVVRGRVGMMIVGRQFFLDQRKQRRRRNRLHHVTRAEAVGIRTQHPVVETSDDDRGNPHLPGGDQLETIERAKQIGRATSELQSPMYLVCRLLLEKKKELLMTTK